MAPKRNAENEWKIFWQKLAIACMTVCGVLVTGMVKRFTSDFDKLTSTVEALRKDVAVAVEAQGEFKRELLQQQIDSKEIEGRLRRVERTRPSQ